MKRLIMMILLIFLLALPANALDLTAPPASGEAGELMPTEVTGFGSDLWTLFKRAVKAAEPEIAGAAALCLSITAVAMLTGILQNMPGKSAFAVEFAGVIAVALLLMNETKSLIQCAADTVEQLSQYGKLLLPVMTAGLAAQGGMTSSTALYTGTALFDALLSAAVANLLIPLVYIFLALCIAATATGQEAVKKLTGFIKWLTSWGLKTVLYIFTGYMSITHVISGAADEAAVKATKLTMSGMIPMVGGILSDASEAVIVGAGLVKNGVGVYGMLAILAIWIAPFLRIGICYLILKLTATLCEAFSVKGISALTKHFSEAMGMLLAMTASLCIMLMISALCFMKGMG